MDDKQMIIHKYKGLWWLPQNSDLKIPGLLDFSFENGATLSLFGTFHRYSGTADFFNQEPMDPPVLLGTTYENVNITLCKCQENYRTLNESTFYARDMFVGRHFMNTEDIIFNDLSVNFSYLDEWGNFEWFKHTTLPHKGVAHIRQKIPDPILIGKVDDGEIYLDIHTEQGVVFQKEISIKQKAYIRFDVSRKKPFEELMRTINNIQNFLTLAVRHPIYLREIKADYVIRNDATQGKPVDVYRHIKIPSDRGKRILPSDMYFSFNDVRDNIQNYISNWLKSTRTLHPIYNLYFGTCYQAEYVLEPVFLSFVSILESYHRRKYGGKYQADSEFKGDLYEKLINAIPDSMDKYFRQAIISKLKYLNEYSLRRRLSDVINNCPPKLIHNILGEQQYCKKFIEKIVTTRNYFTHYDKEMELDASLGNEIYGLIKQLEFIIDICFHKECGFDSQLIEKFVSQNRYYIFVVRDFKRIREVGVE